MKWGNRPVVPSRWRTLADGDPGGGHWGSGPRPSRPRPPPRRSPSPVLPGGGAGEKCSAPVGAWGYIALRRALSCGKAAGGQHHAARGQHPHGLAFPLYHGADHAPTFAYQLGHRGRWSRSARPGRRPTSPTARPARFRWSAASPAHAAPGRCHSAPAAAPRRPRTWPKRVTLKKCSSSLPEPIIMPTKVISRSGGRRRLISAPSSPPVERGGDDAAAARRAARRVGGGSR